MTVEGSTAPATESDISPGSGQAICPVHAVLVPSRITGDATQRKPSPNGVGGVGPGPWNTRPCDVDGSRSISGCGWYVEVQHTQGVVNYVTRYCHMVRRPSVRVGQVVATGAVLGYVGTSGSSSGPHLHFEVHSGVPATHANAVDPIRFMIARRAPLA